ncbi:MAG TPA: homoserine kinase [Nitrosopumilaceae archaeon]|nr:homoserine kinase [Nitrosopumilaceae archaeon]HXV38750.1 homoserine kinase [Nitrosopumilaceae archaeon]
MVSSVVVRAPSSTANLGPGFDVFGLALDAFYDEVRLEKSDHGIKIQSSDAIPLVPEKNSAGLVVKEMTKRFRIKSGVVLKIKKGVPAGFGMGSSAASAAAAAVAFDALFNLNLDSNTLVKFAGMGERASAGSVHYDNVAASTLGGFVIVRTDPFDVIKIEPPKELVLCVAIPKLDVPMKKTQISRSVLPKQVKLSDSVRNLSNAAAIVAGFMKKDVELIGNSIKDIIIEPARQHLIPGFNQVKENALHAGALGVTISGAGPSIIAFTSRSSNPKKICNAMEKGFMDAKTKCDTVICRPSKGAIKV